MHTYDAAAVSQLERLYSTPQIVAQRRRLRAVLAARPGEAGLDIGCGAGHLACELAREVSPGGRIVALDSSAESAAACNARATREGVSEHVAVCQGDAGVLDFPDESFDFVVASQVYCFVADVGSAIRQAARVLKKGGRLLVLESDWDLCLWRSSDPALTRRMVDARSAAMYAHAHLPRDMPALVKAAGLTLTDACVHAILETHYEPDSFGAETVGSARSRAVKHGSVSPAEAAAWEADLLSGSPDDWFFCLNRFIFTARK